MCETLPAIWQVPRREDFVLKGWPDGVVVYDEANGNIHALTVVAGEAFLWIREHGLEDPIALLQSLADENPSPEDLASLQVLLQEFEALGFIERVPV
jgi:PqqD family protein of HPr-rel-A system